MQSARERLRCQPPIGVYPMIEPPADSGTEAATPEQNKLSATISVSTNALPLHLGERYELQGMVFNKDRPADVPPATAGEAARLLRRNGSNVNKKVPAPSRPRDQRSFDVNSLPERSSLPHYSYPFGDANVVMAEPAIFSPVLRKRLRHCLFRLKTFRPTFVECIDKNQVVRSARRPSYIT